MAISSEFPSFLLVVTYGRTDGRTDIRTDKASYRDARTHLKIASFISIVERTRLFSRVLADL